MKSAARETSQPDQMMRSTGAVGTKARQLRSVDDLFQGLDTCEVEHTPEQPGLLDLKRARQKAENGLRLNDLSSESIRFLLEAMARRIARDIAQAAQATTEEVSQEPELTDETAPSTQAVDMSAIIKRFGPTDSYFQVLDAMNAPVSNASRVAEAMADSPKLASFALSLVNGPSYGLSARVDSLPRAVAMAGFHEISGLALAVHLFRQFSDGQAQRTLSMLRGILSRTVARRAGLAGDWFFAAGLLADAGRLALAEEAPALLAEIDRRCATENLTRREAEERVLGEPLSEVTARMLREWDAPEELVEMVRLREIPHVAGHCTGASVMHLAEILAQAAVLDGGDDIPVSRLDERAVSALGLDGSVLGVDQAEALRQSEELARSLCC